MSNTPKPDKISPPHHNPDAQYPAAGQHTKLMDENKTPGVGTLALVGEGDDSNALPTG